MKMKCIAALSVALWTIAGTSFAADGNEDPWRFSATVPIWAPAIDGDVTVRGRKADVGISFDQLKDHLDAVFALGLEARKEKFGFFGDFGYMKFSGVDASARGAKGDAELKMIIADAGMAYRLVKSGQQHPFILEATAGLRYWNVDTDIKLTGSRGRVLVNGGDTKNLYDPVIGLRGSQYLTPKCHLDFAGDIGGFGLGHKQSDLDWSAAGLVSYDFAKWFTLSAGYKALAVDKSEGSGTREKGVDLIFHGLLIAANFTF